MSDEPKPEGAPKPPEEPLKPTAESKPAPPVEAAKPAAPPAPPKPPAPKPPPPPAVMQTAPWEDDLPSALREEFGDGILGCYEYLGQRFVECSSTLPVAILSYLKLEFDFDYLVDVTAVDYPNKPERFELIYIVYSFARNERIRIKTRLPLGARAASAFGVHLTADWLEREVFDMFGIEFDGHPNMKRILLPDEWDGHPLRKDYGILQMDNQWVRDNLGIESGQ